MGNPETEPWTIPLQNRENKRRKQKRIKKKHQWFLESSKEKQLDNIRLQMKYAMIPLWLFLLTDDHCLNELSC